ncbi:glycoside hydrolase family 17 protein [Lophiostoma macrostomum CBS 122681]|uniref:Glycoside hydrolase family 17 protein n=1 Tax=Lophiostoma macrostomum CBS 122681 TaxID=1314788 RepID=A0A6A6TFU4_9PLEO|nr:glycoside hydrolase family 17 protein [Lophiostoma macrostomum CBS 122681]
MPLALWLASSRISSGDIHTSSSDKSQGLKRDLATEVTWTTVTIANVYVYVDDNGVPYETKTIGQVSTVDTTVTASTFTTSTTVQATPSPERSSKTADVTPSVSAIAHNAPNPAVTEPAVSISSSVSSSSPASSQISTPVTSSASSSLVALPAPSSSAASSAALSSKVPEASSASTAPQQSASPEPRPQTSANDAWPIGVTYDPYTSNGCRSDQDVAQDFDKMKQFGVIRIYGSGCNMIPLAVKNAKRLNLKVLAGIWLTTRGSSDDIDQYIQTLFQAVRDNGGSWDIIAGVSVENERVNDKDETASAVVDAVNRARSGLRKSGFNGPVAAVETVPAILGNPAVCQASDVVMANIHPFFDTHANAESAGQFVKDQVSQIKNQCGGKRVIVTESGWPTAGDSHDNAVPSPANQKTAIDSLNAAFSGDLFFFNAFDDAWKSDFQGSYNAETHWGILH